MLANSISDYVAESVRGDADADQEKPDAGCNAEYNISKHLPAKLPPHKAPMRRDEPMCCTLLIALTGKSR